jgi:hypothetical protein
MNDEEDKQTEEGGWVEPCSGTGYEPSERQSLKKDLEALATGAFFIGNLFVPMTICGIIQYNSNSGPETGSEVLTGMMFGLFVTPMIYLPLLGLEALTVEGCVRTYKLAKKAISYARSST